MKRQKEEVEEEEKGQSRRKDLSNLSSMIIERYVNITAAAAPG
jgi:hypothetical protein